MRRGSVPHPLGVYNICNAIAYSAHLKAFGCKFFLQRFKFLFIGYKKLVVPCCITQIPVCNVSLRYRTAHG